VGESLQAPSPDGAPAGNGDTDVEPAHTSLRLIDAMSRRIDVLARELHLEDEGDRPRAA